MRKKGRGEIVKVSQLFEAYRARLAPPQGVVLKTFCELILELFNYDLKKEQCAYSVQTKILSVRAPGPIKSEILFRKKEILTHLRGRIGEKAPKDIL